MDFCGICEQAHERRAERPVEPDPDALFGVPVTPDLHPIPDLLVPFDRERRFREEFEVSEPPVALDG